jgi:hypothetical protein
MAVTSVLSFADFEFAAIYRDFAVTMSRSFPRQIKSLWFTGEWGFRAYLEQAGGRELGRRDGRAQPGDLLVVPTLATPYSTLYSDKLSDGMQFTIRFLSSNGNHVLSDERIEPGQGRIWKTHELLLPDTARQGGKIVLDAGIGNTGNANADWIAIARARIALQAAGREQTVYDFRQNLDQAQIIPAAGMTYDTPGKLPVVPMDVWLEQMPATILRSTYQYRPRLPIRLLDSGIHAGFWSSSWGLLPYSFGGRNTVLETISVYEVTREVDNYGERPISWYEK